MNEENDISLLRDLYHIDITNITDDKTRAVFLRTHHFLKAQEYLTPKKFNLLLCQCKTDEPLLITDSANMHLILFSLGKRMYAAGPFFSLFYSLNDCKRILHFLPAEIVSGTELMKYINRYPLLAETDAVHIICTLIQHTAAVKSITMQEINYQKNWIPEDISEHQKKINYTMGLTEHYQMERTMMHDIEEGNASGAAKQLKKMLNNVAPLVQGTTLENERISAAITRTMVRIAAANAGMPAVLIDTYSSRSSAFVRACTSPEEIEQEKFRIIEVFCAAIQQNKKQKYSNLTLTAMNTMERMYASGISIAEIADELNVSTHTLDHVFHQETGQSPSEWLKGIRNDKATELLINTDLSIQDISNAVGIFDANYFVKFFRKTYAVTPSQYRKIHLL